MTTIRQDDFIDSVADALQFISYYHPLDFVQAVHKAWELEQNPAAKDAMAQILINSRMCAEGHRPICQDTGIVTVFLKIGMDVRWDATLSVSEMVNEGVRRAYTHPDNVLRASTWNWCRAIRSMCRWRPRAAARRTSPSSPCSTPRTRSSTGW
jgi:fumarate hydratase class I